MKIDLSGKNNHAYQNNPMRQPKLILNSDADKNVLLFDNIDYSSLQKFYFQQKIG